MPMKIDNRHKVIGGTHRASARYYMLCNRVKNTMTSRNAKYSGVEIRCGKGEFIEWFKPRDFPRCSVDRIDKSGHYELPNMQVIPLAENIAKDKRIASNGTCRCYSCRLEKPIEEFAKDKRRIATGRSTLCKACDASREKRESTEARERRRAREANNYQKRKLRSTGQ